MAKTLFLAYFTVLIAYGTVVVLMYAYGTGPLPLLVGGTAMWATGLIGAYASTAPAGR